MYSISARNYEASCVLFLFFLLIPFFPFPFSFLSARAPPRRHIRLGGRAIGGLRCYVCGVPVMHMYVGCHVHIPTWMSSTQPPGTSRAGHCSGGKAPRHPRTKKSPLRIMQHCGGTELRHTDRVASRRPPSD
ncbi:hypothetical protein F5Y04DRAFT_80381 [Hypomontagnella monticulosa]|nr:hypothetical protein F5Y04DRAFT_80381 [Hypomontagnella monticulosa]